jgi:membrane protein DedA with SNARE-associated domain
VETSFTTRFLLPSASASLASFAFLVSDCSTNGDPLGCRLDSILHVLYIAAVILGLVLLVVAILAYRTYRQNKAEAAANTRPEKKAP